MQAFVFPGQGVQYVGMGKKEWETSAEVRKLFASAEPIVGQRLIEVMFHGPVEELNRTANAQPAIFLVSYARFVLLQGSRCDMAAGHSLGEYAALVAAGVLSFSDALELVYRRGRYMQEVCDSGPPGTMAAISGLGRNMAEVLCWRVSKETKLAVCPANFNSHDEIVISGHQTAVQAVLEQASSLKVNLITKLRVSGAFHSPLMEPARLKLARDLDSLSTVPSRFFVYSSTARGVFGANDDVRGKLQRQLTAPVEWLTTVQTMIHEGATSFIDVGPKRVLYHLIKSSFPHVDVSIPLF